METLEFIEEEKRRWGTERTQVVTDIIERYKSYANHDYASTLVAPPPKGVSLR
jgi:hypothetical protein